MSRSDSGYGSKQVLEFEERIECASCSFLFTSWGKFAPVHVILPFAQGYRGSVSDQNHLAFYPCNSLHKWRLERLQKCEQ